MRLAHARSILSAISVKTEIKKELAAKVKPEQFDGLVLRKGGMIDLDDDSKSEAVSLRPNAKSTMRRNQPLQRLRAMQ